MLRTAVKQDDLANALLAAAKHGHEHIVHLLLEAGQPDRDCLLCRLVAMLSLHAIKSPKMGRSNLSIACCSCQQA